MFLFYLLGLLLGRLFPHLGWPTISEVSPRSGWPGSILTLSGSGFSPDRDSNSVMIGGVPAVVMDATPTSLTVIVGPGATSGPVSVTVSGGTAHSAEGFTLREWPDEGTFNEDGPPRFFVGPQQGTPALGVTNQPLLVIFCFPTDHNPGGPVERTAQRADEISRIERAGLYWSQASYGGTSFAFQFTDWLPLPNDRNFYMWQGEDIDDARRILLSVARRGSAINGDAFYAGHTANGLQVVDILEPMRPRVERLSSTTFRLGGRPTSLRVAGSYVYASTGADGLTVFEILEPDRLRTAGHVPFDGWLSDLDVSGSILVATARERGLLVFDLSDPTTPRQVGSLTSMPPAEWATAVKLVGDLAYVITGTSVRIVSVQDPSSPTEQFHTDIGQWAMDIDVEGTMVAIATDGDGVHVFNRSLVGAPTLTPRFVSRASLRTQAVAVRDGVLFVGAEDGLRIVRVSGSEPEDLAFVGTTEAVIGLALAPRHVYVSVGVDELLPVDISDLRAPRRGSSVHVVSTFSERSPLNLWSFRQNLRHVQDSQDITQRPGALWVHALSAARDAGFDLNSFEGFFLVVRGPFLRGQSRTTNNFEFERRSFAFSESKGAIYIATNAAWGRIAHEIGHWLGMPDIYTDRHADGTVTPGTAEQWDLGGSHDAGPLFSGHVMSEIMHFYQDPLVPGFIDNVAELRWSPTQPHTRQSFDIVAHDEIENSDPNRVHLVRITVSDGMHYYVEVRQRPTARVFDQNLPISMPDDGAVVVTRVMERRDIANSQESFIMLFGVMENAGQQVVDAARRLVIRTVSRRQSRPLVFQVEVEWNAPTEGTPGSNFDPYITAWDHNWQSKDIWINNPRNDLGSQLRFEFHEDMQPTMPILNGDRPWIHHSNKIFARIRNGGTQPVNELYVTFYATSPPGIGDNGSWATLGTKRVGPLPGRVIGTPGSGEMIVDFDWIPERSPTPERSEHTCLRVEIMPIIGESQTDNNLAQENVAVFDSAASSSHQPVVLEAEVRNPFTVWRQIEVLVKGLPEGWHAVVNRAWVWLPPRGAKPVRVVIWTDLGTPAQRQRTIPRLALARVEGWTRFEHRLVPIGGILAIVKANRKVVPSCEIGVENGRLSVRGCLKPPLPGVPITVAITDERGAPQYVLLETDTKGCFALSTLESDKEAILLERGEYKVQVFVTAGGEAAETECPPLLVTVP